MPKSLHMGRDEQNENALYSLAFCVYFLNNFLSSTQSTIINSKLIPFYELIIPSSLRIFISIRKEN